MSELSNAEKQADSNNAASSHTLLEGRLGYRLESALLVRALTHRSYAYENGGLPTNERLEFLGDSVLGLVVTDTLYTTHPDLPEGQLAKLRAAVVNSRALAEVGRGLDLGSFIRLGRGEEGTGGRDKASILADTLEAVIGAVYLDQGLDAASELVHRLFDPLIEKSSNLGAGLDWKTSLQELTAAEGLGVPEYLVTETGPDHEKTFTAAARVGGVSYGTGTGRSKKEAEQQAAESAWRGIRAKADERIAAEAAASAAAKVAVTAPAGTAVDAVVPASAEDGGSPTPAGPTPNG
ncbi:ribonuclease III [Streptomyces sp. NPDC051582]|uniref:ribonuclease III n=1 Tax=Streptomyces sp. NPDC051582 TaxID=3155167 RepID=UPI003429995D